MHLPVLLKESIDILNLERGDVYLDATYGQGGHHQEVKRKMGDAVTTAGIDADPSMAEWAVGEKFAVLNFRNIKQAPEILKISPPSKILFDLGWNKSQFEDGGRGFSFQKNEPLLMTYGDPSEAKFTTGDVVNKWQEENLKTIISAYGEEKFAGKIAKAIVETREKKPIKTSKELAQIIYEAVPSWYRRRKIHPATKTFQALRIAVNDELQSLKEGLEGAIEILKPGGRLAVISFHSLEDRIVKNFFKKLSSEEKVRILTKKPIRPSIEEVKSNPRARSAKLRAIQKIDESRNL